MGVIVRKIDFSTYRGLNTSKTWNLQDLQAGVLVPYDMSAKTIVLRAYDRSEPIVELYELTPTVHSAGGVLTFPFLAVQTDYENPVDYLLVEDPLGASIVIGNGTFTFVPITQYIPYSQIIANETPAGVVISENYITLKTYEWRLHLQNSIDPHISDEDVQNEAAWPTLVNILIAKLVVYDFIIMTLKGLLGQSGTSGSETTTGSGNVKKIQTGPTEVEFFDSMTSISNFASVDKAGNSALQNFAIDICQLARRVKIYLFMCGNTYNNPFVPLKAGRPDIIPLDINLISY